MVINYTIKEKWIEKMKRMRDKRIVYGKMKFLRSLCKLM